MAGLEHRGEVVEEEDEPGALGMGIAGGEHERVVDPDGAEEDEHRFGRDGDRLSAASSRKGRAGDRGLGLSIRLCGSGLVGEEGFNLGIAECDESPARPIEDDGDGRALSVVDEERSGLGDDPLHP